MNRHQRSIQTLLVCGVLLTGNAGLIPAQEKIPADLPWSQRMALSEMQRFPEAWMIDFQTRPRWGYVNGLVLLALEQVWKKTGDDQYLQYIKGFGDKMVQTDGTITDYRLEEYNIDRINPGKILFNLYKVTGEKRYRQALELLREQLRTHPRVPSGGFWHKQIYTNQMWLDGIYMGQPFYAQYAATFGEPEAFDDIALHVTLLERHARDPQTGLLYHAWDESRQSFWCDAETGLSKNFWSRGMGWYAMALVDVLDFFPEDHPRRGELIAILRRLAAAVSKVQDASGVWYQVLDQGGRAGNYLEATGSCMFVYTLLKGVRREYLDPHYLLVAAKGYRGIHREFIKVDGDDGEVHLRRCCAGAGLGGGNSQRRDGTFEYYISERIRDNDGKGTGPFILLSLEVEQLGDWIGRVPAAAGVSMQDFELN